MPWDALRNVTKGFLIALVAGGIFMLGHAGLGRATRAPAGGTSRAIQARPAGGMEFSTGEGRDAPDVPRPPDGTRVGAFAQPGGSGALLLRYSSGRGTAEVESFYRAAMPKAGWTERKARLQRTDEDPGALLWYSNARGDSCMIALSEGENGSSFVSILRGRFAAPSARVSAQEEGTL